MTQTAGQARTIDATQPGRPPRIVQLLNPIARRLLAAGVPMGVNALVTVAGRRSGLPGPRRSPSSRSVIGGGSGRRGARRTGCETSGLPDGPRSRCTGRARRSVSPS